VNNFLGEGDIHPLGFHRGPAGSGFRTGMTPAILVDAEGGVMALGTGGSNRIRTAMLQVIRHITAGGMNVEAAVMAPRIHVEGDSVEVEDVGQEPHILAAASSGRQLARFEGRHLYFGGVHSARRRADGTFEAFGDPRRSGAGIIATREP
jgi:gamma-glutamyltranspeptidase/glutathione hydrolase